jgi:hypothetical protein
VDISGGVHSGFMGLVVVAGELVVGVSDVSGVVIVIQPVRMLMTRTKIIKSETADVFNLVIFISIIIISYRKNVKII